MSIFSIFSPCKGMKFSKFIPVRVSFSHTFHPKFFLADFGPHTPVIFRSSAPPGGMKNDFRVQKSDTHISCRRSGMSEKWDVLHKTSQFPEGSLLRQKSNKSRSSELSDKWNVRQVG